MKQNYLIAVVLIFILMAATTLWAADEPKVPKSEDYIIGAGDVLDIMVWDNDALTKLVTVLPDGKIRFPLIGEVVVSGKTLNELEKELKKRIDPFVPNPNLSVMVQQANSMLIYVIGEVNRPGRFSLITSVNVMQALAMAGGFSEWAKKNKIKIFRETEDKTEVINFSYDDIVKEKNIDSNIKLKRGDVVFVPY